MMPMELVKALAEHLWTPEDITTVTGVILNVCEGAGSPWMWTAGDPGYNSVCVHWRKGGRHLTLTLWKEEPSSIGVQAYEIPPVAVGHNVCPIEALATFGRWVGAGMSGEEFNKKLEPHGNSQ